MRSVLPRLPGQDISIRSVLDGLSPHERKNYSVTKAILAAGDPKFEAGLEREVHAAIAAVKGITPVGDSLWVPMQMRSGLVTGTSSAGGYLVESDVKDLIELLRPKSLCLRLGAELLSGLRGTVDLPVQATGSSGSWLGENVALGSDVDASFGQKVLSPHQYCASTSYSRKLLRQASVNIENFVRADLMAYVATALDAAIIAGTGASNDPVGILSTAGIDVVAAGTNGAQPTWQNCLDMEAHIGAANADIDMAFITTLGIRSRMKNTVRVAGQPGGLMWTDDNMVNGYPAYATTNVPSNLTKGTSNGVCHAAILGRFSTIAVGEFGAISLTVDPYSQKKQGQVQVTIYAEMDCVLRTPQSFSVVKDFLP